MENIYNNYRNIVERAVLAGIITDENKHFYLAAIDEENDSDLSELECRLNMEETRNQRSHLKQKNDNSDPLLICNENEEDKVKENHTLRNKNYLDDCHSFLSEDTIENNSILDLKCSKSKDVETQETDSEASSHEKAKKDSKLNHNLDTARMLSKVLKKPVKNQLIDFDVPIYTDIKKKSFIKPHATDSRSSKQCAVSYKCCCKKDNAKILGCEQSQNICKWTLPRTTLPEMETEKDISPPSSKNCVSSRVGANNSCHPEAEISSEDFQEINKSMKRKSVHTYSVQKENSELYKIGPTISKNQNDDSILNQCHCRNEKHTISVLRRLKVPKNISTQDRKYRIRLKKPLNSVSHRQLFDTKNVTKVPFQLQKRAEICKHCECRNASETLKHTLNDNNSSETASEDKASLPDIPSKRSIQDKDYDRFLNVNIICQFYQDGDEVQIVGDNQDPNNARTASDAQVTNLKTEEVVKPATESCKTKQSKKIHRLS